MLEVPNPACSGHGFAVGCRWRFQSKVASPAVVMGRQRRAADAIVGQSLSNVQVYLHLMIFGYNFCGGKLLYYLEDKRRALMLRQKVMPKKVYLSALVRGVGRLLDMEGVLAQYDRLYLFEREADSKSLWLDWKRVGKDIEDALWLEMDKVGHQRVK